VRRKKSPTQEEVEVVWCSFSSFGSMLDYGDGGHAMPVFLANHIVNQIKEIEVILRIYCKNTKYLQVRELSENLIGLAKSAAHDEAYDAGGQSLKNLDDLAENINAAGGGGYSSRSDAVPKPLKPLLYMSPARKASIEKLEKNKRENERLLRRDTSGLGQCAAPRPVSPLQQVSQLSTKGLFELAGRGRSPHPSPQQSPHPSPQLSSRTASFTKSPTESPKQVPKRSSRNSVAPEETVSNLASGCTSVQYSTTHCRRKNSLWV
jgi:hypothetical protein